MVSSTYQPTARRFSLRAALALMAWFCVGLGLIRLGVTTQVELPAQLGAVSIMCTAAALAALLCGRHGIARELLWLFVVTAVSLLSTFAIVSVFGAIFR